MTSVHPSPPRHRRAVDPVAVALVGGPAVLAAKVGPRLERDGHRVTSGRAALGRRQDVVLLLDDLSAVRRAATAAALRARGTRVGMLVVGSGLGRPGLPRRTADLASVRSADAMITATRVGQDRLAEDYGVLADLIPAGATVRRHVPTDLLEAEGLVPRRFHLVVPSRSDGRLDQVVEGHLRSGARLPLVVVGDGAVATRAAQAGRGDPLVRVLTGAGDRLREQLAAHALVALHSDPEPDAGLLDPMGCATAVLALDTLPNREVAGTAGLYFRDADELAERFREVERFPLRFRDIGELMQERVRARHEWDVVAERYGALAVRLAAGASTRDPHAVQRADSPWRTRAITTTRTRPPG